MNFRLAGNSELSVGVSMSVDGCCHLEQEIGGRKVSGLSRIQAAGVSDAVPMFLRSQVEPS